MSKLNNIYFGFLYCLLIAGLNSPAAANPDEPLQAGQYGEVQIGHQPQDGNLFIVKAPWASECRINGRNSFEHDENGNFKIIYNDTDINRPDLMRVVCVDASNEQLQTRQLSYVHTGTHIADAHRRNRLGVAVASWWGDVEVSMGAAVNGKLNTYHPFIVHFPSSAQLNDAVSLASEKEIALKDWQEFKDGFCLRQSRGHEANSNCKTDLIDLMRDEDLKIFTPQK